MNAPDFSVALSNQTKKLMTNIEIWKSIPLSNLYEVSNLGNVRATARTVVNVLGKVYQHKPKKVSLTDNGNGYKLFGTCLNRCKKNFYIHRVVAQLFVANPHYYSEVNHIDCDKSNNKASNLEWVNTQQNRDHAVLNNLVPFGERAPNVKLTEAQVIEILQAHEQDNNVSRTELGKKYGVGDSKISTIIRGNSWRRVWESFHNKKYEPNNALPRKRVKGRFVSVY